MQNQDQIPSSDAAAEFRLSITKALGDQLALALEGVTPAALSGPNLDLLAPRRGGVYQLYYEGALVYIGKADTSVQDRLRNHLRKLGGRSNLNAQGMQFNALYVDEDLSAVAPETLLIKRRRSDEGLTWNLNGFGNKDPGRERDTSAVSPKHFDSIYPANLNYVCQNVEAGCYPLGELLSLLKQELPYVFRFAAGNKSPENQPAEYQTVFVNIPGNAMTASELLLMVAQALPEWQVTALPGYVIMYPEGREYKSAIRVF